MNKERIWAVNSYIQQREEVKLTELLELYPNLSSMTIRRDIDYLEKNGYIVRTRGGAKSIKRLTQIKEDTYSLRDATESDKKNIVAQKALTLFGGAGTYYFDAGTTLMRLTKIIPPSNCFFVTNAPNIAIELARAQKANIIALGGRLNHENYAISGAGALDQIRMLNIDMAFIGASGYSPESGFTNGSYDECELKQLAISRAKKTAVLMDSSKYNRILPYTFAKLPEINYLVCDAPPGEETAREAEKYGVEVI